MFNCEKRDKKPQKRTKYTIKIVFPSKKQAKTIKTSAF